MKDKDTNFKLKEIKLEVTHKCNLNCIHCSSHANKECNSEIPKEDCFRIIEEGATLGAEEIAFSGGEPLLWPAIFEAVNLASRKGLNVMIYTSGNAPDFSKQAQQMKDLDVKKCIFSVFAMEPDLHDKITKKAGSFQKTMKAIDIALKEDLNVEIHFVPLAINYLELETIAKKMKSLNISPVSVLRFVPQGRGKRCPNLSLNKKQNIELKKTIEKLRKQKYEIRTGSPYNFLFLNKDPKCLAGIDRINIAPDLSIYPCDAFKQLKAESLFGTLEFSSLATSNLKTVWEKSPYLKTIREYHISEFTEPCLSCNKLQICNSGCIAQKVINSNSFTKKADPGCILNRDSS